MDEEKVKYLVEHGEEVTLLFILHNLRGARLDFSRQKQYLELEESLNEAIDKEYPNLINWRSALLSFNPGMKIDKDSVVSREIKERYIRIFLHNQELYVRLKSPS